ncbi:MAG: hypothetical protein HKN68_08730, partial [Saprospiraceae bacterium]|nr:hypothetical protein [Saprospiraceae bacterium]
KVSVVNFLALLSYNDLGFDADSLIDHYGGRNIDAMIANSLVMKNRRNHISKITEGDFEKSKLNIYSASSQINYLLNQYRYYDSSFVSGRIKSVSQIENSKYKESMEYAIAMSSYKRGYVDEAIRLLREIAVYTGKSNLYNYQIGLILMDLGDYRQAIDYLDIATAAGNTQAIFARQICQMELGDYSVDSLQNESGGVFTIDSLGSLRLFELLSLNPDVTDTLNDGEKYLYYHYNRGDIPTNEQFEILGSIEDPTIRTHAFLELFQHSFRKGHVDIAKRSIRELKTVSVINKQLNQRILEARLDLVAFEKNIELVEDLLSQIEWLSFDKKWYFEALIASNKGNDDDLKNYFHALSGMNSFNAEAIISAATFFQDDEEELKSYNILVNALLQNPYSVKLLKEYIKESNNQGLASYSSQATEELRQLMSDEEYKEYMDGLTSEEEL